jgi:hypothetical protein
MHNMFNSKSGIGESSFQLIPNGTLASAVVTVKGLKRSQRTNGEYGSVELTINAGEFSGRKVWTVIMNPADENNSEGGKKMGITSLTRLFEASGLFTIGDEASYAKYNGASFGEMLALLDGKTVAIKIKIAKGKDGYEDKNEVQDFLTPNPESNGYPGWQKLHGGAPAQQAPAQVFAQLKIMNPQGPSKPASSSPAWLQKPGQTNNPF